LLTPCKQKVYSFAFNSPELFGMAFTAP